MLLLKHWHLVFHSSLQDANASVSVTQ